MSDSVRPHRRQPTRLPSPWDSPGKNTGVSCHFLLQCMKVKSESEVAQSCLTLSDPMDCSPPGSSVHGIFQARILEWAAISFSRGSSQPRDRTRVSCVADRHFTVWATREARRSLETNQKFTVLFSSINRLFSIFYLDSVALCLDKISYFCIRMILLTQLWASKELFVPRENTSLHAGRQKLNCTKSFQRKIFSFLKTKYKNW